MKTKYLSAFAIASTSAVAISAIALSGIIINNSYASTTATANASITVLDSCTAGTTDHIYNRTLTLGATETITGTDISITCNDYSGFDLYAVGYSGDSYDDTNTDMISSTNTAYNIKTNGTGNNSYWKMKLEEKNTTGQVDITSAFTSFTTIPSDYTKVASRNSSTSTGSITITPSYQVHISTTQPAGSYTGKVKYTIVHPNGAAAPNSLTIAFADANVFSVKICAVAGDCTGTDLKGTISTSGDSVTGLKGGVSYYLYPAFASGYELGIWLNTGDSGTLSCTADNSCASTINPTFTMGAGAGEISISTLTSSYTVNITSSNTTSGASSITVPYGGSNTVTVTPSSGYYLSSVSCPSGYTCTGYNTGLSYTSQQTVTVTNNNTAAGGTLAFTGALACQSTVSGTMQAFNPCSSVANGISGTLTDARDSKTYTVKKINGQWWMTKNLRFTGTSVTSTLSNVTADKTLTYYDLATNGTSGGQCYSTTGYSNACIKDSGNTSTGVWYNYYAATAGTVSGSSNSTAASQDICPKNWHLPTGPNTTANTDINKLVGNTTSGWQDPNAGLIAFGAVAGGYYYNGSLSNTGYGYWWSATANAGLRYYSSNGRFSGDFNLYRYSGSFVRCVRSS